MQCTLRLFPTYFASIIYFTFLKSHFFILITHFYKIPHIPFSILQSFYLNILSLFLFVYYFIIFTSTCLFLLTHATVAIKRLCNGNFFQFGKNSNGHFLQSYVKTNCVQIFSTSFFSSSNKDSYIHLTIFIKIHISSSIFFQDSLIFTLYFSLYGSLSFLQITF
jgi:hypothetical protein